MGISYGTTCGCGSIRMIFEVVFFKPLQKWIQKDAEEVWSKCVTLYCTFVGLDWWCGAKMVVMEGAGGICVHVAD